MSAFERSPLACLVLVMVCLSIAGSLVAGLHYYAVDLPQQKALQAPANGVCIEDWMRCRQECDTGCRGPCQPEEQEAFNRCFALCDAYYPCSG